MELRLYRHLWGNPRPVAEAVATAKAEGYLGIECRVPPQPQRAALTDALERHGMGWIAMVFTEGDTPAAHADSYLQQVEEAIGLGARQVTSHSGRDAWTAAEADTFFSRVLEAERGWPITVAHETHRGRVLFNPWATARLLERFPTLWLACDYSHWVCVAERLLPDCDDILARCAGRCAHLHARVGYPQGPQVPHPAAGEHAEALAAHERWWREAWTTQAAAGRDAFTVTPEFGPPPYLHTLPFTDAAVADLDGVVRWMTSRLRTHTFAS